MPAWRVGQAGIATVFPQPIGLAAMFDEPFVKEIARKISDEVRRKIQRSHSQEDLMKSSKLLPDAIGGGFWRKNTGIAD